MFFKVFMGAVIPFVGTSVGALVSFFSPEKNTDKAGALISGFASGVMVAASVWSLLIPSVEYSVNYGSFSFVPAVAGLFTGTVFMLLSDRLIERKAKNSLHKKRKLMYFAVTLHNIPEGMAIGAAYSAYIFGKTDALLISAFVLSLGIAIQNVPEGAIVALPYSNESGRLKGFIYGALSGAVEPLAVFLTVLLSSVLVPFLPYMLSFAAGAMLYVVMIELSGDFTGEKVREKGITSFILGFSVMMSLDVALG